MSPDPDATTRVAAALEELLAGRVPAADFLRDAQPDAPEVVRLTDAARGIVAAWSECQAFVEALARGSIDPPRPSPGNVMAEPLKHLHDTLAKAVWQAVRVADGDLAERIKLSGALGQAFNRMVDALVESRSRLDETIVRLKESREALQRLATEDPLTGLFNRRHFLDLAHAEVRRSHRYGRPLAVVMLDLDHFKNVNDSHGHAAGDAVLVEVAKRIGGELRLNDQLGRLGGEEFALLLPESAEDAAFNVSERVREVIAASPVAFGELMIPVTVSLGVAVATSTDTSIEGVLVRADRALYKAKSEGRNRTVLR